VLGGTLPRNSSNTAFGVAVDSRSNAYVTGITAARDFPTLRARQPAYGGGLSNAFVTKLNASGGFVYSGLLGGSRADTGNAIAVDGAGRAYVTGATTSPDFPAKRAVQPALAGSSDAFVTTLSPMGSSLVSSTYLGGSGADVGLGLALGRSRAVYVTGQTASPDFPTVRPVQRGPRKRPATAGGGGAAFVTSVAPR